MQLCSVGNASMNGTFCNIMLFSARIIIVHSLVKNNTSIILLYFQFLYKSYLPSKYGGI